MPLAIMWRRPRRQDFPLFGRQRVVERAQRRSLGIEVGEAPLEHVLLAAHALHHVVLLVVAARHALAAIGAAPLGDVERDLLPAREQRLLRAGRSCSRASR